MHCVSIPKANVFKVNILLAFNYIGENIIFSPELMLRDEVVNTQFVKLRTCGFREVPDW